MHLTIAMLTYRRNDYLAQVIPELLAQADDVCDAQTTASVLIVDNRGGWRQMVEHGKTGWLCGSERDFIYYASKMACEPNLRDDMAEAARARGLALGGLDVSLESWKEVLEAMARLPE